jgi:hypothetical protein
MTRTKIIAGLFAATMSFTGRSRPSAMPAPSAAASADAPT